MTDKELAEEYEENAEYVEIDDYGHKVYGSLDIEQAYLAGLKADRPKWHKVADGDLPKDDRYYLIFTDRRNYYVSKHHCNTNYWIGIQNQYVSIKNVVAWCEIPKYTEE